MLNKAVIDLRLIKSNALAVKARLKKGVKFCAVVKADAYGHGAPQVASAIYNIVDCYAVALVEEGVELRRCGIDKDILVLNPIFEGDAEIAVRYNLTLTVADELSVFLINEQCEAQNKTAKIHIKYNTGMNRHGVDGVEDLSNLIKYAFSKPRIIVDGMYSHLGCPQNKKLTTSAINEFLLANNLVKGYNNKINCHISASGGFLKGEYFDMVRIGILLYGYKPFESKAISVSPAMKIFAPVTAKRNITKGECCLYGEKPAEKDLELTVVRYGYADGLERKEIDGQFNNRCMDLTAMQFPSVTENGAEILSDAEALAKQYGTISYEILTKAAIRAEKIYIN